jgi:hypothetical protein
MGAAVVPSWLTTPTTPLWLETLQWIVVEGAPPVIDSARSWLSEFAPREIELITNMMRFFKVTIGRPQRRLMQSILFYATVGAFVGMQLHLSVSLTVTGNVPAVYKDAVFIAGGAALGALIILCSRVIFPALRRWLLRPCYHSSSRAKVVPGEMAEREDEPQSSCCSFATSLCSSAGLDTATSTAVQPLKQYIFVDFNAWEFAESEELWAGLIKAMYVKVEAIMERHQDDWKRKWRVQKAIKLLKEKYGAQMLRARVALLAGLALSLVCTVILEAAGVSNVIAWILEASNRARSLAELLAATVVGVAAVVPSLRLVALGNQESSKSRGAVIFEKAQTIRDRLGFLSHVKGGA